MTELLRYRADIDGLRALAVLGVVLFHIGVPGFAGGFVGVDLFFAISGYLISRLLLVELQNSGRVDLAAFFARRVRRLLPALLFVLLTVMLVAPLVLFPEELPRLGKSAMAVPLLWANHHFMQLSGGYFDPAVDLMPLLHTWSLSVEEQFYLLWPLLFMALAKTGRAIHLQTRLLLASWAMAITSFGYGLYLLQSSPSLAYFLMPARAWEFALGAIAGLLPVPAMLMRWRQWLAGASLLVLGWSLFSLEKNADFPGFLALPPVLAISVLMWLGGAASGSGIYRGLGWGPLRWLGKLSYSWYLWHWPLLALGRAWRLGERDLVADALLGGALALLLAWLTYHLIEQPIRQRRPWGFARTRSSLWLGAGMSLTVVLLASACVEYGKYAQSRQPALEFPGKYQADPARSCQAAEADGQLAAVDKCTVGPAGKAPAILLWGDSHADHYSPLFDQYGVAANVATLRRERGSCPPLAGVYTVKKGRKEAGCAAHSEAVLQSLSALRATGLQAVVLSSRWGFYQGRQPLDPGTFDAIALLDAQNPQETLRVGESPLDFVGSLQALRLALDKQLGQMTSLGLRVLIIAPSPELPYLVPSCVRRRGDDGCSYPQARVEARRAEVMQVLTELATKYPVQVRLLDPVPLLCQDGLCRSSRNGILLYSDSAHLTSFAAQAMQPAWQASLDWAAGR